MNTFAQCLGQLVKLVSEHLHSNLHHTVQERAKVMMKCLLVQLQEFSFQPLLQGKSCEDLIYTHQSVCLSVAQFNMKA